MGECELWYMDMFGMLRKAQGFRSAYKVSIYQHFKLSAVTVFIVYNKTSVKELYNAEIGFPSMLLCPPVLCDQLQWINGKISS